MAEFPALPLFTDAYLGDTRHLTTLQHGAYLLMLMIAWRTSDCSLPDNDEYLARITGMDKRVWQRNKSTLLAFWKKDDHGNLVQGRLLDERQFVVQVSNKNSVNVKARWLKNNNRKDTTVIPNAYQTDTPTPTPTPIKEISSYEDTKKRGTRFDLDALPNEWDGFCKNERPELNSLALFSEFADYWRGVPGQRGVKLDWLATWRNWVRNKRSGGNGRHEPRKSAIDIIREGTERARLARERESQDSA